jgi:hypothetical protein
MEELSNEDYVLLKNGKPYSLDVIYHYTSVIELFNDYEFNLENGEEFVCMTDLSIELQKEYLKELNN